MNHRALVYNPRLSPCARVVLLIAAESLEPHVPFRKLPPEVQRFVQSYLQRMAAEGGPQSLFGKELVAQNPAPERVRNTWKWRATRPVMNKLRIPRFALECELVRAAYPTRNLTRVDISDIVRYLRVQGHTDNLIAFVGEHGMEKLSGLIQATLSRIS